MNGDNTGLKGKRINHKSNASLKGFTLVELIVVLVILAIIAAVAVPAMLGFTDSAKEKEYIANADAALKASQAVLTDLSNNAMNRLEHDKRYGAARTANIDPDSTEFRVWTVDELVDGHTTALLENKKSYTIQYAFFKVSREDGAKCVFYDGKNWTVYENEEAMPSSVKSQINDTNNIVNMWPDYTNSGGPGEDYGDTAYNNTSPGKRNWETGEESDKTSEIVTITLCGYNTDKSKPWIKFVNDSNSNDIKTEVQASFEVVKKNGVLFEVNSKEWFNDTKVQMGTSSYSFNFLSGFSNLNWCKDKNPTEDSLLLSGREAVKNAVGKGFIKNDDKLYISGIKDTETKTILLKAYNSNTLSFGDDEASQCSVTLYNYTNKYDSGNYFESINSDLVNAIAEGNVHVDESCEQSGWAFGDGTSFEMNATNDNLKTYSGAAEIWNKAFDVVSSDLESKAFYGNLVQSKKVILLPGTAEGEEELKSHFKENAKEFYTVSLVEILKGFADDLNEYNSADNELQVDSGYRFDYWKNEDAPDKKFYTIKSIREYVEADTESGKAEYTFTAVLKKRGTALFLANESSGSLTSQIKDMAANDRNKLYCFDRVTDWDTFIGAIGTTNASQILDDIDAKEPKECSSNSKSVLIDSGSIYKIYVLYDGGIEGFSTPVFAYVTKNNNKYRAYWYCDDNVSLQAGSFSGLFADCKNLNLSGADLGNWDVSDCTDMSSMFKNCSASISEEMPLDLSSWDTRSVTNLSDMFSGCEKFTSINLSNMFTSKVTSMAGMFNSCKKCTSIVLDRNKFVAEDNITSVEGMFSNCNKLEGIDLRGFGTCSKLTNISSWFNNCWKLKYIDLSQFSPKCLEQVSSAFNHVGMSMYTGNNDYTDVKSTDGCAVFAKEKWKCASNVQDTNKFSYFRPILYGKIFKNSNSINNLTFTNDVTGETEKISIADSSVDHLAPANPSAVYSTGDKQETPKISVSTALPTDVKRRAAREYFNDANSDYYKSYKWAPQGYND